MVRHSSLYSSLSLLFILGFIFSSCKKDEPVNLEPEVRTFPNVDQRLWHLFEAFEQEAAARGIEIDLVEANISGEIDGIAEEHVAGQCSYNQFQGDVTVDEEFWSRSNGNFQEFIVFHELGHCYLHLEHREGTDELGFCTSIMRSGLGDCRDNYNLRTRSAYIDELFEGVE